MDEIKQLTSTVLCTHVDKNFIDTELYMTYSDDHEFPTAQSLANQNRVKLE